MRVAEGRSWTDAILQTIPPRKGAKPKEANNLVENDLKNHQDGQLNNKTAIEHTENQETNEIENNSSLTEANSQEKS